MKSRYRVGSTSTMYVGLKKGYLGEWERTARKSRWCQATALAWWRRNGLAERWLLRASREGELFPLAGAFKRYEREAGAQERARIRLAAQWPELFERLCLWDRG